MSVPGQTPQTSPLPTPQLSRWQPLRAGLVDLFYYDRDEFWFRDGRLLLRGNNGTGKSKVLALMLPFLLDADLSAHRVEPDADPKKRMEWNLLLGGAHPNNERLGYTWLEFGRLDEDGVAQYCTIGAGLKAMAGRGMAPPWFFVTSARVGDSLHLVDHTGVVLTKDRLTDALHPHGIRYDRANHYRRAVDEALFGLGEQRYGALVDLLIQLRQPQLSKRPSEQALSAALTEALPPLDQSILADVAEAFRSLEEDRDALADLKESTASTASFLTHYRRYARIVARQRSVGPRQAQRRFDALSRELAAAEAAHESAETDAAHARQRQDELDTAHAALAERERALRDSEIMDSARELDNADALARDRAADAARADDEAQEAELASDRLRGRHDAAEAEISSAAGTLATSRAAATAAAADAGVAAQHRELVDEPLVVSPPPGEGPLKQAAQRIIHAQGRAVAHLRGLHDLAAAALRSVADARREVDALDSRGAQLGERAVEAQQQTASAARDLVAATRTHLAGAAELRPAHPEDLLAELEAWADTAEGVNPAAAHLQSAADATSEQISSLRGEIASRASGLREDRAEAQAEAKRLESGDDATPPVPYVRGADARADRPGAPLWRVTEFDEALPDSDRAGLEAALEAAGILDAWLSPDGALLVGDLQLLPESAPAGAALGAASLAAALRPAIDFADPQAAALTEDTVAAALAAIGLGPVAGASTWVAVDGAFRVGALAGAWRKDAAEFIGSGAREAARRARLATLAARLVRMEEQLAELAEQDSTLQQRRRTLAGEIAAVPTADELRQAHSHARAVAGEQRLLAATRVEADARVAATEAAHQEAAQTLAQDAADAGLPAERAELDRLHDAMGDYRVRVAELCAALPAAGRAEAKVLETRADLERAEEALVLADERLSETRRLSAAARERYTTLRENVGTEVEELHELLSQAKLEAAANRAAHRVAAKAHEDALEARGTANGHRLQLAGQVEDAKSARAAATEAFRRFAASGLLAAALPALELPDASAPWSVSAAAQLARRVDQELSEVGGGDDALAKAQRRVAEEHKSLADVLGRQGNATALQIHDDGILIEVTFRGRPTTIEDLAAALEAEYGDRERLLSEHEREILENHLVSEVASTMQELIAGGEDQVARMNAELDSRPTSTGMRLRLYWQPREDGPDGTAAAVSGVLAKLRQTTDAWSEEDRREVGAFLQDKISEVRLRNAGGTWLEHLTEALDYRTWNRFVIKRHQNGQWRSATGPASGGERVLAASVPLFAAASAHYGSAGNPHAPRLVTLDEAFAGVDDNARAKYLGLLAAFDLDVVMTSEREWGCYPEVPALAIAQLSRTDDVPAVLVTRWEWDGERKARGPEPDRAALAEATPVDPDQEKLWG